jgi:hypothetical protein
MILKPFLNNLQQEWSRAVSVAAANRLAPVEMALGDADFIHAEARARPVVAILTAKLSNEFFRFSPRDFVAWFCFRFRLPQIPTWAMQTSLELNAVS